MRAINILNSFVYSDVKYEIYLFMDVKKYNDKYIGLNGTGRYKECADYICVDPHPTRISKGQEVECDLIIGNRFWLDLRYRGISINRVDNMKQFKFLHWEFKDNKIIFVYGLVEKEVTNVFDTWQEAFEWVRR